MKKFKKTTAILLLALSIASFAVGCGGCGTDKDKNMNDMVESNPAKTEESLPENGGNATANDITGSITEENGNIADDNSVNTDENGNLVDDAGNIITDAGDMVGDAVEDVGDAAKDVTDGVGEGVKDIVK